ncbi:MAG: outer membrane beta-barrel protein [Thiobacillus sp.]|nr:outer membrane beta-barrel protein [Thiobacillus sp.]
MRTIRFAAAVASALALSTPASAGFFDFTLAPFVGASVGQATSDISCPAGTSCDDSDLAWKLFGGLEVNEYISMEFGYVDMGEVEYTGAQTGVREVNGVTMRLIGSYALNPSFTLTGSGGLNILNADVKGTTNAEDTDVAWSVGLGAQYNFTKSVGLRMEWERFFEVGSSDFNGGTGEADIDLITAGVVFKF